MLLKSHSRSQNNKFFWSLKRPTGCIFFWCLFQFLQPQATLAQQIYARNMQEIQRLLQQLRCPHTGLDAFKRTLVGFFHINIKIFEDLAYSASAWIWYNIWYQGQQAKVKLQGLLHPIATVEMQSAWSDTPGCGLRAVRRGHRDFSVGGVDLGYTINLMLVLFSLTAWMGLISTASKREPQ